VPAHEERVEVPRLRYSGASGGSIGITIPFKDEHTIEVFRQDTSGKHSRHAAAENHGLSTLS
jgi:hypothetical protein